MSKSSSIFKTPEGQAKYLAAYDATLALWPVPYESLDVPTRFGSTHIIISGPKDAPPLVLLPGANDNATAWYPNIGDRRMDNTRNRCVVFCSICIYSS